MCLVSSVFPYKKKYFPYAYSVFRKGKFFFVWEFAYWGKKYLRKSFVLPQDIQCTMILITNAHFFWKSSAHIWQGYNLDKVFDKVFDKKKSIEITHQTWKYLNSHSLNCFRLENVVKSWIVLVEFRKWKFSFSFRFSICASGGFNILLWWLSWCRRTYQDKPGTRNQRLNKDLNRWLRSEKFILPRMQFWITFSRKFYNFLIFYVGSLFFICKIHRSIHLSTVDSHRCSWIQGFQPFYLLCCRFCRATERVLFSTGLE